MYKVFNKVNIWFGRNLALSRSQAIDFEFLKDKVAKYFAGRN
jgi:hypothetical protein